MVSKMCQFSRIFFCVQINVSMIKQMCLGSIKCRCVKNICLRLCWIKCFYLLSCIGVICLANVSIIKQMRLMPSKCVCGQTNVSVAKQMCLWSSKCICGLAYMSVFKQIYPLLNTLCSKQNVYIATIFLNATLGLLTCGITYLQQFKWKCKLIRAVHFKKSV